MADVNTQSCDVCGVLRQETNHWYRAIPKMSGADFAFCVFAWEESDWFYSFCRVVQVTSR